MDTGYKSDEDDFKRIGAANYQRMKDKLSKIGYADGAAAGEETGQQIGFNAGFADGLVTAFEIQKYKSFFEVLENKAFNDTDLMAALRAEKRVYMEMEIPETESKTHCQYLQHKDETTVKAMSQHQQKYMNQLVDQCRLKLPVTSNFLEKQP